MNLALNHFLYVLYLRVLFLLLLIEGALKIYSTVAKLFLLLLIDGGESYSRGITFQDDAQMLHIYTEAFTLFNETFFLSPMSPKQRMSGATLLQFFIIIFLLQQLYYIGMLPIYAPDS